MGGYTALHAGDESIAAGMAEQMEDFTHREGVTEVTTEAASVWALLNRPDRARPLLEQLDRLEALPRDVNYLLNLYCVLEAALVVGDERLIGTAARLLTPYENRAVVNAGAVYFHGVTDDVLARAAAVTGDTDRAEQFAFQSTDHLQQTGRHLVARPTPNARRTADDARPAATARRTAAAARRTAGEPRA